MYLHTFFVPSGLALSPADPFYQNNTVFGKSLGGSHDLSFCCLNLPAWPLSLCPFLLIHICGYHLRGPTCASAIERFDE